MFRLLRYFSVTAGIAIVAATAGLSYAFYQHEVGQMVQFGEKQNINTARLLANALRPELMEILSQHSERANNDHALIKALDARVKSLAGSLAVVKVKFYSLDGKTLYSSDFSQIGEDKSGNQGIVSAVRDARSSSKLSYRDEFTAFSHVLANVAMVETYVPMVDDKSGAVVAVFELYSDVTTLVGNIQKDVTKMVTLLILAFCALYGVLFVLVRHADKVLKRQYRELAQSEERIRDKNQLLEQEVLSRQQAEQALQAANESLEVKVQERTSELASAFEELKAENLQRQQAETRLHVLSTAVEQSPSSVVITDTKGIVEYANPRFFDVSGYMQDEVVGKENRFLKSGEMPESLYSSLWESISQGREWRGELLNRKKDGSLFWEAVSISPIRSSSGDITHYVAVNEDISLRKSHEHELLRQANYDSLTGLANRLLVKDRLSQAISRAQRTGTKVAVLFIDLDDFKKINDSLGHSAGDELLVETARRLETCVRVSDTVGRDSSPEGDTVARLGGDEFVVILTDVHEPAAVERVAGDILQAASRSFTVMGQEVFVTNSIGITLYPDDGSDIENLMRNADLAMYQAKESGRGIFRFFTNEFNDLAIERLILEAQLRHAIEKDELSLYYQPIISNTSDKIAGAEALLRWNHETLGHISPERFIPIAESTGLIVDIGHWVLEQGFRDFAELSSRAGNKDFYLSLNVSSRQLREPGFADDFGRLVKRYGISLEKIKAEITESLILEDTQHTQMNLAALVALGVRFSVDDFGTGYSSLRYLKKLPVDTLKIDRSFVSDVCTNQDDASLVQSIAAMARGLCIQVIAEGVETAEQKRFITEAGCDFTQGYLTGIPVPLRDFNTARMKIHQAVEA